MFEVSRTYTFSAAHRIEGHPKCGRLHGHNYTVQIGIQVDETNSTGMVIDYARLDDVVKPILDAMDHRYLVSQANVAANDPYARIAMDRKDAYVLGMRESTAELIAQLIRVRLEQYFNDENGYGVVVTVSETLKSTATYVDS
jgi:6-pyruvoyl tetrahydropterin synthase/QueD family protein